MNILEKANEIVNLRSEEKERQYGPFKEGMERAAMILSGMTGQKIEPEFMYKAMVALKLSRESYNHKEDNLLDAVAYIGALNNHHKKTSVIDNKIDDDDTKYASFFGLRNLFVQNPDYECSIDGNIYDNLQTLIFINTGIANKSTDVYAVKIVGNQVQLRLTKQ